eukprot:364704-Chlamydomonas_euryale.AAC.3
MYQEHSWCADVSGALLVCSVSGALLVCRCIRNTPGVQMYQEHSLISFKGAGIRCVHVQVMGVKKVMRSRQL